MKPIKILKSIFGVPPEMHSKFDIAIHYMWMALFIWYLINAFIDLYKWIF